MKRTFASITAAALCGLFAVSVGALAEKPENPGGGGGGGGKGGGKPTTDVFSDMVIIDRDVNGVPITTLGLGPRDKWVDVPQPIMFGDKEGCILNFTDLERVGADSVYTAEEIDARYIPFVGGEIIEPYKLCMTEADVGRLSVVRAPDDVLDRALLEMVNTLDPADYESSITLDAAGRLVVTYYDGELVFSKTIDAPAENLAAFQRILEQAELYHEDADNGGAPIELPVFPTPASDAQALLDRTAAMFGAAADKFGHVGLDDVIYVTQILTIADDMNADATGLFGLPFISDELGGGYFNFTKFEYDRSVTYGGDVCYLNMTNVFGQPGDSLPIKVTGEIVKEPIMDVVFAGKPFSSENAYGYAKAVDDARAVIFWIHEHPVPGELIGFCNEAGDAVAARAEMTPSKLYQRQ